MALAAQARALDISRRVDAYEGIGIGGIRMAMAFVFEVDTMTAEQYDGLMGAMGLAEKGAISAHGALAHIAGPKDGGGWRVVDVWDSEEAANAFYTSDTFAPVRDATAGGGITTTPWPVHRMEV
jgi:hypothetical protein